MANIEIYTRPGCGYCRHAKHLLSTKGLRFREYDVYQYPQHKQAMHSRTANRSYPQIFIDGVSVGGFTELLHKAQENRLPRSSRSVAMAQTPVPAT
ncbi:glutaredoxin [Gammaproteobacteria bacterium 53_120_T64]|nr:glutaredoxin [Gammaproteobacteria bacterium 53_120_T64]